MTASSFGRRRFSRLSLIALACALYAVAAARTAAQCRRSDGGQYQLRQRHLAQSFQRGCAEFGLAETEGGKQQIDFMQKGRVIHRPRGYDRLRTGFGPAGNVRRHDPLVGWR